MTAVSKWLIGIFAVAVIGVALDLLFSGSRMSGAVRYAAATVTLIVIIAPIPSMVKSGFSFSGRDALSYEPKTDEHYLGFVSERKAALLASAAERSLEEGGISGAKVTLSYLADGAEMTIEEVRVNLRDSVIDDKVGHINKNELAIRLISERFAIDKGRISVYG